MKRHGEKADISVYINQSKESGKDDEIMVEAGAFKVLMNGGEVL